MDVILVAIIAVIAIFSLIIKKYQNNDTKIINYDNNKPVEESDNRMIYEKEDSIESENTNFEGNVVMEIEDVFTLTGKGTVVTGRIIDGELKVGDSVNIQSSKSMQSISSTVVGIEMFRNRVTIAQKGDTVGIILSGVTKEDINMGDCIIK